jgi:arginine deiminase
VFLMAVIDTLENRDVAVVDIPGTLLHAGRSGQRNDSCTPHREDGGATPRDRP